MSTFSNKATDSAESRSAYVEALLHLLGDQSAVDVLREGPAHFAKFYSNHSKEQLRTRESPDKWSAGEVLAHMADSELMWSVRLRRVLTEDEPELSGYDQDVWASKLGYRFTVPGVSLETFRVLREANLAVIESLSDEDLRRCGRHGERGTESLEHMIRLYAGHDLVHLKQIERILRDTTSD